MPWLLRPALSWAAHKGGDVEELPAVAGLELKSRDGLWIILRLDAPGVQFGPFIEDLERVNSPGRRVRVGLARIERDQEFAIGDGLVGGDRGPVDRRTDATAVVLEPEVVDMPEVLIR